MEKVNTIGSALGLPPDMAASMAISAACEMMGIVPEPHTPLPLIADALIAAIGCEVLTTAAAAPVAAAPAGAAPAAAAAPAATAAPAVAGGKRKPAVQQKQMKIFDGGWHGSPKLSLSKKHMDVAAGRKEKAVPFEELCAEVALDVRHDPRGLPSERAPPPPPPKPVYPCGGCDRTLSTAMALGNHSRWKHPSQPVFSFEVPPPSYRGDITTPLSVSGDNHVKLEVLINGKNREQVPCAPLCQGQRHPLFHRQGRPLCHRLHHHNNQGCYDCPGETRGR